MNFDLFTTGLTLAGAEVPRDRALDGKDLLPMLTGQSPSPHEALFFYRGKNLEAVRTRAWKYHRVHKGWADLPSYVPKRPVLVDLATDPNESYNVIERYPEAAREMEDLMAQWESSLVKGVPGSGRK